MNLRFQNLKIGTVIKSFKLVLVCEFRKILVVIPTYNESENIEKLIQELKSLEHHIMIVDDNSQMERPK